MDQLTGDWRVGMFSATLLLPAGLPVLVVSVLMYGACFALKLVIEARYGVAAGACKHAAVPLTVQRLLAAAARQPWRQLLPAFAQSVLLPVLVSYAWAWLHPTPPPAARTSQHAGSASSPASLASGSAKPGVEGARFAAGAAAGATSGRAQQQAAARDAARGPSGKPDTSSHPDQEKRATQPAAVSRAHAAANGVLYRRPVSGARHLLLHLKVAGPDAAAEAAFVSQLPGALASRLGSMQAAAANGKAAAALQLLDMTAFPGGGSELPAASWAAGQARIHRLRTTATHLAHAHSHIPS
jgi:hypothetical protein